MTYRDTFLETEAQHHQEDTTNDTDGDYIEGHRAKILGRSYGVATRAKTQFENSNHICTPRTLPRCPYQPKQVTSKHTKNQILVRL